MKVYTKVGGWVGFDLDGTLAHWPGTKHVVNPGDIGAPIPGTVAKARSLLADGVDVRILTARVAGLTPEREKVVSESIGDWTETHLGKRLAVTSVKDRHLWALYDDRAIQVERNTGVVLGRPEALGL